MDYAVANVYRRLGRLDIAEAFAVSSVRKWPGTSRRDSVLSESKSHQPLTIPLYYL